MLKVKTVFARYGYSTCHGSEGKGGVKNPNSQGGEAPPIYRVAEGFSEEEVKKVIRDGRVPQQDDPKAPIPPPLDECLGERLKRRRIGRFGQVSV